MSVSINNAVSFTASKNFVEALKTAGRICPKRSTLPALQYLHLSFKGDDITIEATDLEVYYRQTVFIPDLDVVQPFSLLVNREAILAMKAPVMVTFSETFYSIGGIKYTPSSTPPYPKFPALTDNVSEVTLGMRYFSDLAVCAVSASTFEVRPVLTGVCHRRNEILATDGMRLCLAQQEVEWTHDINVPAVYAAALHRAFGKSGAYMAHDDHYARYKGNGFEITVRLIQGAYPDITRIIPTSAKTTVVIPNIESWISALDRVLAVHKQAPKDNRDSNNSVNLSIGPSGVGLSVRREQEFSADLASEVTGPRLDIACNAQYLKEALEQIGSGAQVQFNGSGQPLLLESAPNMNYRRRALVSPIGTR